MNNFQYPPFSESEYARRYAEVKKIMERHGLGVALCYGNRGAPGMLHYLANFQPRWETFLVFPYSGEPVLFVQLYNHAPDAQRNAVIADTRWGGMDTTGSVAAELQERGLSAGAIGLAGGVPYQRYQALRKALPEAAWVDLTRELGRLRWIKSEQEIAVMRRAAELTDLAVAALAEQLRPGMREIDLLGAMQAAVQMQGGQVELCYLASTPMQDPSAFVPAQTLSERRIQAGDVVITEIGVSWGGYAGQIHRPLAVGTSPSAEYQQLFEVASEAYYRVAEAIRPGASEQEVLAAAEVIHEKGFTICDDLVHGFGGGYLPPVLRTRRTSHGPVEPFVFEKNMCVVIQPNVISRDRRMGIQLGQLHVVGDDGLEPLQHYPLEFIVTGAA